MWVKRLVYSQRRPFDIVPYCNFWSNKEFGCIGIWKYLLVKDNVAKIQSGFQISENLLQEFWERLRHPFSWLG